MKNLRYLNSALVGGASVLALVSPAAAKVFDIPGGDLSAVLVVYMKQSNVELVYVDDAVHGHKSHGAKGDYTETAALTQLLRGTGFTTQTTTSNTIGIVPQKPEPVERLAQAARRAPAAPMPAAPATIETVVVTAQHKSENIQQVPIAVTALSQQQLTERQIAGGPDLVKEVPNLTFSKTNFSGYNLEIRGIGTQAISVTTDPAVAVAFNDIPFIRNHFFEQEFYDLADVEVLRGPQGTLYGRNATAGVVDIKSALPTDTYEAMMSADLGNYNNRRLEGMLNLPIVGDTLDLRIAGEWTKRDGYTTDTTLNTAVDSRDLWSGRMTIGWKPASDVQTEFVWEHFSEDDDRLRSGKQLCKTDYGPGYNPANNTDNIIGLNGAVIAEPGPAPSFYGTVLGDYLTQGCSSNVSMYSPQAYQAPLGYTLPYVLGAQDLAIANPINPYGGVAQSTNLRDIESQILPNYRAKNDTLEFNANWTINPALTFTSATGYNNDFLWSSEDFNRFGSVPGFFVVDPGQGVVPDPSGYQVCTQGTCYLPSGGTVPIGNACGTAGGVGCAVAGYFCDPQVGCSDRLITEDLSTERAWQLSQEFRLSSSFSGPFNFTAGGNYLHYETFEKYYVFSNALTRIEGGTAPEGSLGEHPNNLYQYDTPGLTSDIDGYWDPNPISSLNDQGHNYFLSQNPYILNSYAVFGDANYDITNDLKLIAGLRWTDDQKHFLEMPSWVATTGYGYPVTGVLDQSWERFTGRAVANWTPQLEFTDQTLLYASYAHGYKAGGANPPGAELIASSDDPVHPLTFKPEYIEAFELGTKNTMLGGALTLNGDVFYYNYTGYQISEIVDRTAINNNYNAHVEGAELETNWEPVPGLKFGFNGGFENAVLAGGDQGVDLLDRTAGHAGWYVMRPFPNIPSSCIFPGYMLQNLSSGSPVIGANTISYCAVAYQEGLDPLTAQPYVADPKNCNPSFCGDMYPGYPGFNPATAPNDGEGFSKNLGGNQLPNAPHFTTSLTAEYTMPVSDDWAATFHTDFYWQSQQWARVFEDPIDKIHGYSNVNLSLILTSANGWQIMGYVKNVFDVTAITGTFLNSDDTGLTTNVFLTDPRLFGVRVTKHLDQGDGFWGSDYSGYDFFKGLFSDTDNGKPPLWIDLGGQFAMLQDDQQAFTPPFFSAIAAAPMTPPVAFQHPNGSSFDWNASVEYTPDDSDWIVSAFVRYGRTGRYNHDHQQLPLEAPFTKVINYHGYQFPLHLQPVDARYFDAFNSNNESHAIFDFAIGKDVGLGMLGLNGNSNINGGLRFVQFTQSSGFSIHANPDVEYPRQGPLAYYHRYSAADAVRRSFHGIGPSISWKASTPVIDNSDATGMSFDWGANGAILFGRQIAQVHHQTTGLYLCSNLQGLVGHCKKGVHGTSVFSQYHGGYHSRYQRSANSNRGRTIAVPNIGGFAGISWRYSNAKVSFGYRADEFFGAMDGGIDTHRSENVGFFGPFANISIGLGG
jgi:iron complex outermembrane receptor protein